MERMIMAVTAAIIVTFTMTKCMYEEPTSKIVSIVDDDGNQYKIYMEQK